VADDLTPDTRRAVRDLVLVLADSKRLLGMRYAGWILGAPDLETGIACASMAQDEWGHGRLLYSLLREFDDDVDRVEHGRDAADYANIEVLDAAPDSWPDVVALIAFVDSAISVQFESFRDSSFAPLRQRVEKLIEEERFHSAHGRAWIRRLANGSPDAKSAMKNAAARVVPAVLRWFGPASDRATALREAAVSDADPHTLRSRWTDLVEPLLESLGAGDLLSASPDFDGFDEAVRRTRSGGPDPQTIEKVRGDKNRAFLMD
jgi:ring-1,2-phenylacetyl-CoA epoxidase subunit PaaC